MKIRKRGFTLIELLVVIAIIAILAAILFPVFAQAKIAAKKTTSISNVKQLELSVIMYAADVDDGVPPATAWNPQDSPGNYPFGFGDGWCAPWTFLVLPYVKSGGLFDNPLAPATPNYANNTTMTSMAYPSYGYNYVWLSPWDGSKQSPIGMSSVGRPAETVMMTGKWSDPETDLKGNFLGWQFNYASDAPLLNYTVDVPDCWDIPQFCINSWAKDQFQSAQTHAAGRDTGFVEARNGDQAVTGWLDGHTSVKNVYALAAGTTYTAQTTDPGTVHYTSDYLDKYVWDVQ